MYPAAVADEAGHAVASLYDTFRRSANRPLKKLCVSQFKIGSTSGNKKGTNIVYLFVPFCR